MKNFPDWFFDKADWQEKTLGEVAEFIRGLSYRNEDVSDDGIIILRSSNIQNDSIDYSDVVRVKSALAKNFCLKENDILMCVNNGSKKLLGKTALIEKKDLGNTWGAFMMIIRSKEKNNFLYQYFKTELFFKAIYKDSGTTTINQITKNVIEKIKIKFPPLETQKKIAEYFTSLDNAINAQDLKLKSWRDAKKAMLQKIFSQEFYFTQENGEKYPAWQEKTLGDFSKLVRGPFGGSLKKEIFKTSGYKIYEQRNAIYKTSEIGNYFIDEKKFNEMSRFAVKENDFIVSCSGTIGKIYKIPANAPKGIINQALLKITVNETECYTDYFYHHFEWDRFQNKIVDNTQGGAIKNLIGMEEFKNVKIKIPCLEEQKKIAEYFSSLDKIIDAENKMLESLRQMKHGLLQKLFV